MLAESLALSLVILFGFKLDTFEFLKLGICEAFKIQNGIAKGRGQHFDTLSDRAEGRRDAY
jgi:hypothetical protein